MGNRQVASFENSTFDAVSIGGNGSTQLSNGTSEAGNSFETLAPASSSLVADGSFVALTDSLDGSQNQIAVAADGSTVAPYHDSSSVAAPFFVTDSLSQSVVTLGETSQIQYLELVRHQDATSITLGSSQTIDGQPVLINSDTDSVDGLLPLPPAAATEDASSPGYSDDYSYYLPGYQFSTDFDPLVAADGTPVYAFSALSFPGSGSLGHSETQSGFAVRPQVSLITTGDPSADPALGLSPDGIFDLVAASAFDGGLANLTNSSLAPIEVSSRTSTATRLVSGVYSSFIDAATTSFTEGDYSYSFTSGVNADTGVRTTLVQIDYRGTVATLTSDSTGRVTFGRIVYSNDQNDVLIGGGLSGDNTLLAIAKGEQDIGNIYAQIQLGNGTSLTAGIQYDSTGVLAAALGGEQAQIGLSEQTLTQIDAVLAAADKALSPELDASARSSALAASAIAHLEALPAGVVPSNATVQIDAETNLLQGIAIDLRTEVGPATVIAGFNQETGVTTYIVNIRPDVFAANNDTLIFDTNGRVVYYDTTPVATYYYTENTLIAGATGALSLDNPYFVGLSDANGAHYDFQTGETSLISTVRPDYDSSGGEAVPEALSTALPKLARLISGFVATQVALGPNDAGYQPGLAEADIPFTGLKDSAPTAPAGDSSQNSDSENDTGGPQTVSVEPPSEFASFLSNVNNRLDSAVSLFPARDGTTQQRPVITSYVDSDTNVLKGINARFAIEGSTNYDLSFTEGYDPASGATNYVVQINDGTDAYTIIVGSDGHIAYRKAGLETFGDAADAIAVADGSLPFTSQALYAGIAANGTNTPLTYDSADGTPLDALTQSKLDALIERVGKSIQGLVTDGLDVDFTARNALQQEGISALILATPDALATLANAALLPVSAVTASKIPDLLQELDSGTYDQIIGLLPSGASDDLLNSLSPQVNFLPIADTGLVGLGLNRSGAIISQLDAQRRQFLEDPSAPPAGFSDTANNSSTQEAAGSGVDGGSPPTGIDLVGNNLPLPEGATPPSRGTLSTDSLILVDTFNHANGTTSIYYNSDANNYLYANSDNSYFEVAGPLSTERTQPTDTLTLIKSKEISPGVTLSVYYNQERNLYHYVSDDPNSPFPQLIHAEYDVPVNGDPRTGQLNAEAPSESGASSDGENSDTGFDPADFGNTEPGLSASADAALPSLFNLIQQGPVGGNASADGESLTTGGNGSSNPSLPAGIDLVGDNLPIPEGATPPSRGTLSTDTLVLVDTFNYAGGTTRVYYNSDTSSYLYINSDGSHFEVAGPPPAERTQPTDALTLIKREEISPGVTLTVYYNEARNLYHYVSDDPNSPFPQLIHAEYDVPANGDPRTDQLNAGAPSGGGAGNSGAGFDPADFGNAEPGLPVSADTALPSAFLLPDPASDSNSATDSTAAPVPQPFIPEGLSADDVRRLFGDGQSVHDETFTFIATNYVTGSDGIAGIDQIYPLATIGYGPRELYVYSELARELKPIAVADYDLLYGDYTGIIDEIRGFGSSNQQIVNRLYDEFGLLTNGTSHTPALPNGNTIGFKVTADVSFRLFFVNPQKEAYEGSTSDNSSDNNENINTPRLYFTVTPILSGVNTTLVELDLDGVVVGPYRPEPTYGGTPAAGNDAPDAGGSSPPDPSPSPESSPSDSGGLLGQLRDRFADFAQAVEDVRQSAASKVADAIEAGVQTANDKYGQELSRVSSAVQQVGQALEDARQLAASGLADAAQRIEDLRQSAASSLADAAQTAVGRVSDAYDAAKEAVGNAANQALLDLEDARQALASRVADGLEFLEDQRQAAASEVADGLEYLEDLRQAAASGLADQAQKLEDLRQSVASDLADRALEATDDLQRLGDRASIDLRETEIDILQALTAAADKQDEALRRLTDSGFLEQNLEIKGTLKGDLNSPTADAAFLSAGLGVLDAGVFQDISRGVLDSLPRGLLNAVKTKGQQSVSSDGTLERIASFEAKVGGQKVKIDLSVNEVSGVVGLAGNVNLDGLYLKVKASSDGVLRVDDGVGGKAFGLDANVTGFIDTTDTVGFAAELGGGGAKGKVELKLKDDFTTAAGDLLGFDLVVRPVFNTLRKGLVDAVLSANGLPT